MLDFYFLERGLRIVFVSHIFYHLSRKVFLILYSINCANFIAYLSLLLETYSNICIAIVYFPSCDVINFEINGSFLIKQILYMTKKQDKYLNIFREKRAFKMK